MILWFQRLLRFRLREKHLDSELRFHLEEQVAQFVAQGMSNAEARKQAQLELGGVDQVKSRCRDVYWENRLVSIASDVRFAMRTLLKDRFFAITAILALGLGIGATTAVFSVIYSLVFRPFPYKDFQRFTVFQIQDLNGGRSGGRKLFSISEFLAFAQQNHVFETVVGYNNAVNVRYNDGSGTREIFATQDAQSHPGAGGAYVTTNTFDFYGVSPLLGRTLTAEDGEPGAAPVFVMNYRVWQQLFHGDPTIIGRSFILNGEAKTLIGVMPARFQVYGSGIWFPIGLSAVESNADVMLKPVGRLKPGVSLESAAADLTLVAKDLARLSPDKYPKQLAVTTETFTDSLIQQFKTTLYILLAAVLGLLLISCTNVANLLLIRAVRREGEIALRASLGASRARLIRQLLTESFVLAIGGCACGCSLAYCSLKWLTALIPAHRIPAEVSIQLNPAMLLFALALSTLTTLLCGLAPALHAVGRNLQGGLASSRKGSDTGVGFGSLRASLVIAEVGLSVVLLIGAGLMMRTVFAITHVDLGFRPNHVLYERLDLPKGKYETAQPRRVLIRNILDRVNALPGVNASAETWSLPPEDAKSSTITIPGMTPKGEWSANIALCSEGYFKTLGLELIRGRTFSESDVESTRRLAVITQAFARQFFGQDDPIGRKIKLNVLDSLPETPHDAYFEIIGVVSDYRNAGVQSPPMPEVLVPYAVSPAGVPNIIAKTGTDPKTLLLSLSKAVWSVDPEVGIDMSGTLEDLLREFVYEAPQFEAAIFGVFAAIAILLVAVGVYGIMAYTVSMRTHEIGVRMALGAQRSDIVTVILKGGLGLIAAGILAGLPASMGLTRFLAGEVWGVPTTDPWTFGIVVLCIFLTGLIACALPAWRASRLDPLIALRHQL